MTTVTTDICTLVWPLLHDEDNAVHAASSETGLWIVGWNPSGLSVVAVWFIDAPSLDEATTRLNRVKAALHSVYTPPNVPRYADLQILGYVQSAAVTLPTPRAASPTPPFTRRNDAQSLTRTQPSSSHHVPASPGHLDTDPFFHRTSHSGTNSVAAASDDTHTHSPHPQDMPHDDACVARRRTAATELSPSSPVCAALRDVAVRAMRQRSDIWLELHCGPVLSEVWCCGYRVQPCQLLVIRCGAEAHGYSVHPVVYTATALYHSTRDVQALRRGVRAVCVPGAQSSVEGVLLPAVMQGESAPTLRGLLDGLSAPRVTPPADARHVHSGGAHNPHRHSHHIMTSSSLNQTMMTTTNSISHTTHTNTNFPSTVLHDASDEPRLRERVGVGVEQAEDKHDLRGTAADESGRIVGRPSSSSFSFSFSSSQGMKIHCATAAVNKETTRACTPHAPVVASMTDMLPQDGEREEGGRPTRAARMSWSLNDGYGTWRTVTATNTNVNANELLHEREPSSSSRRVRVKGADEEEETVEEEGHELPLPLHRWSHTALGEGPLLGANGVSAPHRDGGVEDSMLLSEGDDADEEDEDEDEDEEEEVEVEEADDVGLHGAMRNRQGAEGRRRQRSLSATSLSWTAGGAAAVSAAANQPMSLRRNRYAPPLHAHVPPHRHRHRPSMPHFGPPGSSEFNNSLSSVWTMPPPLQTQMPFGEAAAAAAANDPRHPHPADTHTLARLGKMCVALPTLPPRLDFPRSVDWAEINTMLMVSRAGVAVRHALEQEERARREGGATMMCEMDKGQRGGVRRDWSREAKDASAGAAAVHETNGADQSETIHNDIQNDDNNNNINSYNNSNMNQSHDDTHVNNRQGDQISRGGNEARAESTAAYASSASIDATTSHWRSDVHRTLEQMPQPKRPTTTADAASLLSGTRYPLAGLFASAADCARAGNNFALARSMTLLTLIMTVLRRVVNVLAVVSPFSFTMSVIELRVRELVNFLSLLLGHTHSCGLHPVLPHVLSLCHSRRVVCLASYATRAIIDSVLGICVSLLLVMGGPPVHAMAHRVARYFLYELHKSYMDWFDGYPAGLKLNDDLNKALCFFAKFVLNLFDWLMRCAPHAWANSALTSTYHIIRNSATSSNSNSHSHSSGTGSGGFATLMDARSRVTRPAQLAELVNGSNLTASLGYLGSDAARYCYMTDPYHCHPVAYYNDLAVVGTTGAAAPGEVTYWWILQAYYVLTSCCMLGASVGLAFVGDMASLTSIALRTLYLAIALMYRFIVLMLGNLYSQFRGQRYNPLRRRVDAYDFTLDQQLIATFLFTVCVFLFPTIAVYFVYFAFIRLTIQFVQSLFVALAYLVMYLPTFPVVYWLLYCKTLRGGVVFSAPVVVQYNTVLTGGSKGAAGGGGVAAHAPAAHTTAAGGGAAATASAAANATGDVKRTSGGAAGRVGATSSTASAAADKRESISHTVEVTLCSVALPLRYMLTDAAVVLRELTTLFRPSLVLGVSARETMDKTPHVLDILVPHLRANCVDPPCTLGASTSANSNESKKE